LFVFRIECELDALCELEIISLSWCQGSIWVLWNV